MLIDAHRAAESTLEKVRRRWRDAPAVDNHALWVPPDIFQALGVGAQVALDRQADIGLHTHEFVEFAIVASGSGRHFINGAWHEVTAGDAFVLPPGAPHAYENGGGMQVFDLLFQRPFWARQLPSLAANPGFRTLFPTGAAPAGADEPVVRQLRLGRDTDRVLALLTDAQSECASATDTNPGPAEWLALYIVSLLCRASEGSGSSPRAAAPASLIAAIEHVTKNLAESFSVDDLAAHAEVSRAELVQQFRQLTGTGPRQFLTDLRVRKAKELLADPLRSITDVALETGFYDGPHLTRTFQKAVGMSPRAYRRQISGTG